MGRVSLVHDAAWAVSVAVVRAFAPALSDADRATLAHDLYDLVRPHLTDLIDRYDRQARRLGRFPARQPEE